MHIIWHFTAIQMEQWMVEYIKAEQGTYEPPIPAPRNSKLKCKMPLDWPVWLRGTHGCIDIN